MNEPTKLASTLLAVGALIAANGFVQFKRKNLVPVDRPVALLAGESLSANFEAGSVRYEIGISTPRGLELSSLCPATRATECVGDLRAFFADRCLDGAPILALAVRLEADGRAAPVHCLRADGEPGNWQELWWMEAVPGQQYEIEATVVDGDPRLQRFVPALRVAADRELRTEEAVALAHSYFGAGLSVSLGLALLIGRIVRSKLRQRRAKRTVDP